MLGKKAATINPELTRKQRKARQRKLGKYQARRNTKVKRSKARTSMLGKSDATNNPELTGDKARQGKLGK